MSSISVGIPNYSRPEELKLLLQSIANQSIMPDEIIISDDFSPNWEYISNIIQKFAEEVSPTEVVILRNEANVGYDANLRTLINNTKSDYLLLIGNDDLLSTDCVAHLKSVLNVSKFAMYSRSFYKFSNNDADFGLSRQHHKSELIPTHYGSEKALQLSAYVGGLLLNVEWANKLDTDRFDGTLYYQIYLSLIAFLSNSLYYIDHPIVSARCDGVPLFGQNGFEIHHIPGQYTADGRVQMWKSLIEIEDYVFSVLQVTDVRKNFRHMISGRFSFHIFEGYALRSRRDLVELYFKLFSNGFARALAPHLFFILVFILKRRSLFFFHFVRATWQRIPS